jgi:hypothetical protein
MSLWAVDDGCSAQPANIRPTRVSAAAWWGFMAGPALTEFRFTAAGDGRVGDAQPGNPLIDGGAWKAIVAADFERRGFSYP